MSEDVENWRMAAFLSTDEWNFGVQKRGNVKNSKKRQPLTLVFRQVYMCLLSQSPPWSKLDRLNRVFYTVAFNQGYEQLQTITEVQCYYYHQTYYLLVVTRGRRFSGSYLKPRWSITLLIYWQGVIHTRFFPIVYVHVVAQNILFQSNE